ncbi:indole-3-glycerol phosphate synthase TrpC [Solirubrum puertoriconensis]|uniref:indole-3-glycerol-phosphate synthase n=1 Tax=Solirubrum puertoriconensis TaxID=1751427 RepID=A0A9X0HJV3_SOLP1|nr:indole-3-glycerol phosphate synthase TrpC [Solirubrum puertoriconensis]KUG07321.1 indole-3-glycerol phosphate synthase [Solirubrum puertoriconensis]
MSTTISPPDVLARIVAHKQQEVAERRSLVPTTLLERSQYFNSPTLSLLGYLRRPELSGIIAEFKRRSPSKGWINEFAKVERTTLGYMQAGASALSILTDTEFFGGKNEDLATARKFNLCPILRKDFVIDEYQLLEARSIGADAVLLIASVLEPTEVRRLGLFAKDIGLEVLLEVHDREELLRTLDVAIDAVDLVGVNNRDLRDFSVNIDRSLELAQLLPARLGRVAESGLRTAADIQVLRQAGFDGFLIGETFMRNSRPEKACAALIQQLRELQAVR